VQAGSSLSALGTPSVCSGVPGFAPRRVTLDVTLAVGASASARWLKPKAGITLPRWSRGFDPRFPLQLVIPFPPPVTLSVRLLGQRVNLLDRPSQHRILVAVIR
jgi:hypothetical protein